MLVDWTLPLGSRFLTVSKMITACLDSSDSGTLAKLLAEAQGHDDWVALYAQMQCLHHLGFEEEASAARNRYHKAVTGRDIN